MGNGNPSQTNATPKNFAEMSAKGLPPYQGYSGSDRADSRLGGALFDYSMRVRTMSVSYEHAANDLGKRYFWAAPDLESLLGYDPADAGPYEVIGASIRSEDAWGAAAAASEIIKLVKDDDAGGAPVLVAGIDGVADNLVADQGNTFPNLPAPLTDLAKVPKGWRLYVELATNGAGYTMGFVTVTVTIRYL